MTKPKVDAYLGCAHFMATWLRIRFIMTFALLWCIVLLGLTGWQMQHTDGNIQSAADKNMLNVTSTTVVPGSINNTITSTTLQATQVNWAGLCESAPYYYVRPFSFTVDGGTTTSCAWPLSNSQFRISIAVLSFVTIFALYFDTPLQILARTIFLFYATAYFAIFIIDADQAVVGMNYCSTNFKNSGLEKILTGSSIVCSTANYAGVIIVDLIQVFTFYFLFECWSMTDNLYSDKGQSNHGARPFVSLEQQQMQDLQMQNIARQQAQVNPMQQSAPGFQPTDSLDQQFGAYGGPVPSGPPPPVPAASTKKSFCALL